MILRTRATGNFPPLFFAIAVKSGTVAFNAGATGPFPLPSFPWHDAQYARYKSTPSIDRINGCCCFESGGCLAVCEPVCLFAAVPDATAKLTATTKHHDAFRIFISPFTLITTETLVAEFTHISLQIQPGAYACSQRRVKLGRDDRLLRHTPAKLSMIRFSEMNGRPERARTADLYRVNFEVLELNPFACLAFPVFSAPKTSKTA